MSDYTENLYYKAFPVTFEKARSLKARMTLAEKLLWKELRGRNLNGYKFRRQHPIERFIADFYCHELKLVIELDGGIHDDETVKAYDKEREFEINNHGIEILRFPNNDVIYNIEKTITEIKNHINKITPLS